MESNDQRAWYRDRVLEAESQQGREYHIPNIMEGKGAWRMGWRMCMEGGIWCMDVVRNHTKTRIRKYSRSRHFDHNQPGGEPS